MVSFGAQLTTAHGNGLVLGDVTADGRDFRRTRSGYDSPAAEGRQAPDAPARVLPELRHVMYMYQNHGELKHDNPMVFLLVSNSRNIFFHSQAILHHGVADDIEVCTSYNARLAQDSAD